MKSERTRTLRLGMEKKREAKQVKKKSWQNNSKDIRNTGRGGVELWPTKRHIENNPNNIRRAIFKSDNVINPAHIFSLFYFVSCIQTWATEWSERLRLLFLFAVVVAVGFGRPFSFSLPLFIFNTLRKYSCHYHDYCFIYQ